MLDSTNKDGLPIRTGAHVGLAAAMHKDGVTSVHDKNLPKWGWFKHASGKLKPFNLQESRDFHERVEDAELQAGKDYYESHRVATEAEHSRMRQMGFDPNEIEAFQRPYIDAAAHEARAKGHTSPSVGNEPYRGTDEAGMRADGDVTDHRFILDKEGNKYTEPSHDKLLGQTEIVIAKRDGRSSFAAIDPNSGHVFARGATRIAAKKSAEKKADDMGRPRLKSRFERFPQLSQQQLREKYKHLHPAARIAVVGDSTEELPDAPDEGKPVPLKSGDVGANIAELRGGKTFAHTAEKFGAARAKKQSIAIAMKAAGKPKRNPLSFGSS